jgi:hypothetical protein
VSANLAGDKQNFLFKRSSRDTVAPGRSLPRADDLPPLDITLAELPTAVNPLGVKGAGQAGCMAAPQTIINARPPILPSVK